MPSTTAAAIQRRTIRRHLLGATLALLVAAAVALPTALARAAVPAVDFTALPTEPVVLPDGWTAAACDGDGPLLCFTEGATMQGVVEHLNLALGDQPDLVADLADGVALHTALLRDVDRYHATIRADRAEVCPDLEYRAAPTVGATVGGNPGVQWGADLVDLATGQVVERTVGFTGLRGDRVDILTGYELNEGACGDTEGLQPFHDGGLGRVTPTLVQLVARAQLGDGTTPRLSVAADTIVQADDAVGTAVALSRIAAPVGADGATVLVARDDVLADALAGGLAQGAWDAPLLLTGGESLDPRVAEEVTRIGAERAVLLGGEAALSAAVADDLADLGLDVERIGGSDRVATALALADAIAGEVDQVLLVRAGAAGGDATQAFADAIGAGALAADHHAPILLTDGAALDPRVAAWIEGRGIEEAVLVGGESALELPVAQAVVEAGIGIRRLAGAERAETATLVDRTRGVPSAAHADVIVLVDGREAADGLTAALLAHRSGAPIVLADGDTLPVATRSLLTAITSPDRPALVCTPSVTAAACAAAAGLLDGDTGSGS